LVQGDPSPLYAAWLPMNNSAIQNLNGTFQTGVKIRLYHHYHFKKENGKFVFENGEKKRVYDFKFWGVLEIAGNAISSNYNATPVTNVPDKTVDGYVVISGKIFNRKHDERFFSMISQTSGLFP
jgi:hypothetical protein